MPHAAFLDTLYDNARLLVLLVRGHYASTARAVRTITGRLAIVRARAEFREELFIKARMHIRRPMAVSTMISAGLADAATAFTLSKACVREQTCVHEQRGGCCGHSGAPLGKIFGMVFFLE